MEKIVIMYQSKYGATKKYAQWLSEELGCDLMETKNAANYEPWEAALMQAVGSNNDWTDRENIKPILDYLGRGEK